MQLKLETNDRSVALTESNATGYMADTCDPNDRRLPWETAKEIERTMGLCDEASS